MAVAASGPNTEILQFAQGGFKKSLAYVENKLKYFTKYQVRVYYERSDKEK